MTQEVAEKKFWDILEDLFVGAQVEGKSGYVNLLKVKSKYFRNYLTHNLREYIDKKLKDFPDFKEELYDKLYSFFHRYFSESGSIYYSYTPLYYKIYDKVYNGEKHELKEIITYDTDYEQIISDKKDVVLFWKTHMLYYIKTDRIIRSMKIEFPEENLSFYFDASEIELKKANEKKELIYELENVSKDGLITLKVKYSERGTKTKEEEIVKNVKKEYKYSNITQDYLVKAIKAFEKQANVDYFINKNAEKFLKEQFDLWMYQYLFSKEAHFDVNRFNQLQSLKDIAYKVIELIAQFEDELRKIWEKPRLVFNSNYVITLDRIFKKEGGLNIIKDILKHEGIENQIKEWKDLGLVEKDFNIESVIEQDKLNSKYQFLPVDTKYFTGLKERLEEIFDVYNIEGDLDGWLIKSENWQALNTILPRFKEKIQTIYIDPPFNLGTNADFHYEVNYKDSTWATMLENRLRLAKELLNDKGSIFVRCDYNGNWIVRPLMNEIFGEENFRNGISVRRFKKNVMEKEIKKLPEGLDTIYLYSKSEKFSYINPYKLKSEKREGFWRHMGDSSGQGSPKIFFGKELAPPPGKHWKYSQEKINHMIDEGKLILECRNCGYVHDRSQGLWHGCPKCGVDDPMPKYWVDERIEEVLDSNWSDIYGYSTSWNFSTENSEILLKRVIESTSNEGDLIMDFFLGSGTTTAVAHKLRRKWIGIEMGEHFYTVILPRMKKVLAYDKSGISTENDVKEKYNKKNAGGFFKYYELEQYEEILKTIEYMDSDLKEYYDKLKEVVGKDFSFSKANPFIFDKKLTKAVIIKEDEIKIDYELLYPDKNIDVKESVWLQNGDERRLILI